MGPRTVSSRLATAGLVGLVALDVVLVGVALRSTGTRGVDTSPVDSALVDPGARVSSSPSPSSSLSATPTPTPSTSANADPTATSAPATPLATMLIALDKQRAWRVTVGSCAAGGARVVTTTDGGATWADAKAPLRMIVRLRPTDGKSAFVIGADSGCKGEFQSTSDGGGAWVVGSDMRSAWFRDPQNPRAVTAPGPSSSQPCGPRAVVDLAVLSAESARVLCADGLVRSTTDTASSWTDSGKAGGGEAGGAVSMAVLSASPAQTFVALVNAPGCAGVQVRRVDQKVATSCISTAVPKEPGQIALSLVDGGGWLSVGDKTMRSTDKMVTWSES